MANGSVECIHSAVGNSEAGAESGGPFMIDY